MKEAAFYVKKEDRKVQCLLCPHSCIIEPGSHGKCRVRVNSDGILLSENYGRLTCLSPDPIEKKPLYHFFPGRDILSLGTFGCNFTCPFCQNHNISQSPTAPFIKVDETSPGSIVAEAVNMPGNTGIAYTYNEPVVWYEYMYAVALEADGKNLKNVVVSNGYISPQPLDKLIDVIHAFNIDLKSFSDSFYRNIAGGSLQAVKNTLKAIRMKDRHLEITHLVVPGLNDSEDEFSAMTGWIADELGEETVLHISRYFSAWKLDLPYTSSGLMNNFFSIAKKRLPYVYLGNMPPGSKGSDTHCAGCGAVVIKRKGYRIDSGGLDGNGKCNSCGRPVAVRS